MIGTAAGGTAGTWRGWPAALALALLSALLLAGPADKALAAGGGDAPAKTDPGDPESGDESADGPAQGSERISVSPPRVRLQLDPVILKRMRERLEALEAPAKPAEEDESSEAPGIGVVPGDVPEALASPKRQ